LFLIQPLANTIYSLVIQYCFNSTKKCQWICQLCIIVWRHVWQWSHTCCRWDMLSFADGTLWHK